MSAVIEFLTDNAFFGITLTLGLYICYSYIYRRFHFPLLNPLLLTIATVILLLVIFNIPYENYEISGEIIQYFLTPATVCFAVPLYRQIKTLREHAAAIFISIFTGSLSSVLSIFLVSKLFNLPFSIYASLAPKSVTTPIAMGIAEELGGIVACTIVAVTLTGILGSICAVPLGKLIRLKSDISLGLATGTSSHAIGTSAVMAESEVAGAMSSLSIAIAGIITVILVPLLSALY